MKDVMLDIETLGNGPNAMVVQFAAVEFDRYSGMIGRQIKRNIDPRTNPIGEIDADTVFFWLKQSEAARGSITEKGLSAKEVYGELNQFLKDAECIWSHATFDFVIINEHIKKLFGYPLYSYRSARDIRTLIDLANVDPKSFENIGVAHDAMSDCLFQIKYCVEAFKKLSSERL